MSTMGGVVVTAAGSPVAAAVWSAAEEADGVSEGGGDWDDGADEESLKPAGADPGAAAP